MVPGRRVASKYHPSTPAWTEIRTLYDQGDFPSAMQRMKALAATGDPTVPAEIAHLYEIGGNGLPVDLELAREWYERAAFTHSDSQAYVALGRLHFAGLGVQQNHKKAMEYFLKSDLENEPGALFALGLMTTLGLGTPQDRIAGMSYFERAAAKGHLLALKYYGVMQFKTGNILTGLGTYLRAVAQILWTVLTNFQSRNIRIQ
jgi:TPR repeat protein